MTAKSFRHLVLGCRKSLNKRAAYINYFVALCMLVFALSIFLAVRGDLPNGLPTEQVLPNYVKEAHRYISEYNERSTTTPKSQPLDFVKETKLFSKRESSASALEHGVDSLTEDLNASERTVSNASAESVSKSNALLKLSEHLRRQVEFLRDAIEEAHHQDLPLVKDPNCTGNQMPGEVEDLLCIPKPKFIKEVRNPCWWDKTGNNNSSTLRCLPFFHILGCERCASSDLWDRITSHPHTVRINGIHEKEADWWGWLRYGRFHYFKEQVKTFVPDYTHSFSSLAQKVELSLKSGGDDHKYLVTGDGTPSDLMDFRGWVNITQNRGRPFPHVLTPHLMKHIYPETTKFIVILRDPIERLYSDFIFETDGKSAQHFHENVMSTIDQMADCIRELSLRQCFFGLQMYRRDLVRLHLILYTPYIMEWLKVIPRERFLFLKSDEYEKDPYGTIKRCFEFLGLESLSDDLMHKIVTSPRSLPGRKEKLLGPMWRSTKEILEEIVRPSMHFLPELLENNRFVWNFSSTPVVEH